MSGKEFSATLRQGIIKTDATSQADGSCSLFSVQERRCQDVLDSPVCAPSAGGKMLLGALPTSTPVPDNSKGTGSLTRSLEAFPACCAAPHSKVPRFPKNRLSLCHPKRTGFGHC